ncbi:hypothetical protein [Nocardiopsis flavescens]
MNSHPYLGRAVLLVIVTVFVCVLVWLGQELAGVVMALGSVSAAVFAMSSGQQAAAPKAGA